MKVAPHVIRDRIRFRSSLGPLKVPAFRVLDVLQDHPADIQLDALALTLTLMAQGAGMDAHELVTRATRQLNDASRVSNPTLEALSDYANGELRK